MQTDVRANELRASTSTTSNYANQLTSEDRETKHSGFKVAAAFLGYTDLSGAKTYCGECSSATIYRMVNAGKLTLYKLGNKTLFKIEELDTLPVPQSVGPAGNDNAKPTTA